SVILIAIAACAVVGNIIILAAIIFKKRRIRHNYTRTTFILVGSLAVADIMVGLLAMPFYIFLLWKRGIRITDFLCSVAFSLDVLACSSSIFHIIMMAVDRYLAISRPLYHKILPSYVSFIFVAIAWIVPTLISVPPLLSNAHLNENMNISCALCESDTHLSVEYRITSTVLSFYIPAIIVCILYLMLYLTIKKRQIVRENNLTELQGNADKKKVSHADSAAAKTIGLILSCFLISWTPFFVLNLCFLGTENETIQIIFAITVIWSYANSMINPFVYYRCNKSIKETVRDMFNC
ncbi:hypothetical protein LOTGIDRAFT_84413, partial [Lottia gigantea]